MLEFLDSHYGAHGDYINVYYNLAIIFHKTLYSKMSCSMVSCRYTITSVPMLICFMFIFLLGDEMEGLIYHYGNPSTSSCVLGLQ